MRRRPKTPARLRQQTRRGPPSADGGPHVSWPSNAALILPTFDGHSLKVEAIHGNRFQTREAMRRTVFEYIAVNYNRMRRSSSIGYLSPESFEAKFAA